MASYHKLIISVFVFSLFLFNIISAENVFNRKALVGDWKYLAFNSPKAIEMTKFAISEHNKQAGTKLESGSVINATYQVVNGIKYRLHFAALDGKVDGQYNAVVWDKLSPKSEILLSFTKENI
ncbi:cysteine proteinase inhibitor 1-like [Impatiens glandulifera]|uniref:cysteine proteinase inhibitor 1-like n=1 Tax=Impatiens glandulifera TaxID=253017 RepID=UPI001FB053E5|nr:cysteine proteinase inhibitor 1-like [Impatiens glandulifera]